LRFFAAIIFLQFDFNFGGKISSRKNSQKTQNRKLN